MIAKGVGAAFVTVMVILMVFVVMLKRRQKRSNSEGSIERNESIWSTSSIATQIDTQVERPITDEKPIQKVAPIPRQPEKPLVPARKNGTSEVRKTTPEVQITASEVQTTTPVLEVKTVEAHIPSHCILRKDNQLKNNHKNLAKNEALLYEEFFQIGVYVRDHVKKDRNIAKQHEYKLHNRYRDVGKPIWLCEPTIISFSSVPFDDNYVFLTSDVFASYEVRYFNASRIVFKGCWMKTQNSSEQVFVPGCAQLFLFPGFCSRVFVPGFLFPGFCSWMCPKVHCLLRPQTSLLSTLLAHGHPGKGCCYTLIVFSPVFFLVFSQLLAPKGALIVMMC